VERLVLVALLVGCAPSPSPRTAPAECSAVGLEQVAFFTGTYRADTKAGLVEEQWSAPCGGTLLGVGRTVAGGKTTFFEFLRVERRADGVFYVAQPRGGPATEFRLVTASANEARFENPLHDFPRVITYRKVGADLVTRVEGVEQGQPLVEETVLHPR